jgi:hypothetical protein
MVRRDQVPGAVQHWCNANDPRSKEMLHHTDREDAACGPVFQGGQSDNLDAHWWACHERLISHPQTRSVIDEGSRSSEPARRPKVGVGANQ